jgi:hypothetical protein
MMRPDYCAIDHLQTGVAATAVIERFEQKFPQTGQRPAPELAVNRRPLTKMLVQITPGNTRPGYPENPIQNKAMIPRATATARTAFDHKRLKAVPFFVAHQTPDHGSLLKSYLESETTPFGNPLCQHNLGVNLGVFGLGPCWIKIAPNSRIRMISQLNPHRAIALIAKALNRLRQRDIELADV